MVKFKSIDRATVAVSTSTQKGKELLLMEYILGVLSLVLIFIIIRELKKK